MSKHKAPTQITVASIQEQTFFHEFVERYWKLGVVLQQIYIRWLRGQTEDARFEPLGEGARALFRLAALRRRL